MEANLEMVRYDFVRHISVYVSQIFFLKDHMHGSFELSYVLDGSGRFHMGSTTRTIHPGDLILTNPHETHGYAALEEKPLLLLTIQIHQLFARRYIESIPKLKFNGKQICELPEDQHRELLNMVFRLATAYFKNSTSQRFDILGYATLLMGKLVSTIEWELVENPDNSDKELQKNRVQRLIDYIDENYRQKITLSMLAEMEGISATHMSHFFRKAFGVSFQDYLTAQRLEKALVLMHDKTISMVDICMNCGFSDSRYLEAACKKTFGCSVSEYRRRCEAQEEFLPAQAEDKLHIRFSRKDSLDIIKGHLGTDGCESGF